MISQKHILFLRSAFLYNVVAKQCYALPLEEIAPNIRWLRQDRGRGNAVNIIQIFARFQFFKKMELRLLL